MRSIAALLAFAAVFLSAAPAHAADTEDRKIAPPPRPIPVSTAQFDALQELSRRPEHARVAKARASYSPEAARTMTEIGVAATQISIPAAILAVLIAAAPL